MSKMVNWSKDGQIPSADSLLPTYQLPGKNSSTSITAVLTVDKNPQTASDETTTCLWNDDCT